MDTMPAKAKPDTHLLHRCFTVLPPCCLILILFFSPINKVNSNLKKCKFEAY